LWHRHQLKNKRYRERRRLNAETEEENKRKDREREKKMVPIKEISARAERAQRKYWRSTQRKCHQNKERKIVDSACRFTTPDVNLQSSSKKHEEDEFFEIDLKSLEKTYS
ncbi:hypothetical protein AVEN_9552-1, partial [Araneus ventricosus]